MANKKEDELIKKAINIFIKNKICEVIRFLFLAICVITIIFRIGSLTIQIHDYGWESLSWSYEGLINIPFFSFYTFFTGLLIVAVISALGLGIFMVGILVFNLLRYWINSNMEKAIREAKEQ